VREGSSPFRGTKLETLFIQINRVSNY